MQVHRISGRLSNCFLVVDDGSGILFDSGSDGDANVIRTGIAAAGVSASDIKLIVHTHVHADHVGSTAALRKEFDCPVASHADDDVRVKAGHNGALKAIGWRGRLLSPFFVKGRFGEVQPDVVLTDGMSLTDYGIDARVIHTPGHTPGSVSIAFASGVAIAGDLLMGGYLGGKVLSHHPKFPYFGEDTGQIIESVGRLLSESSGEWHVGHGGPLPYDSIQKWHARKSR